MRRRDFILGATAAAATATATPAAGDIRCAMPDGWGRRTCEVGVPIGPLPTPWQECVVWCWAACAQAAFGLAGHPVTQQAFAARAFGDPRVCQAADGPTIKRAVDGGWTDARGRSFGARLDVVIDAHFGISHPNPLDVVWQELRSGRPLMVGSVGHATLITAMTYTESPGAPPVTNLVTVRDPWPANPNKRPMTPQEFFNVNFLAVFRFF